MLPPSSRTPPSGALPPPPPLAQLLAQQQLAAQQRPPLHMAPPPALSTPLGSPMASPQGSPMNHRPPPPPMNSPPLQSPQLRASRSLSYGAHAGPWSPAASPMHAAANVPASATAAATAAAAGPFQPLPQAFSRSSSFTLPQNATSVSASPLGHNSPHFGAMHSAPPLPAFPTSSPLGSNGAVLHQYSPSLSSFQSGRPGFPVPPPPLLFMQQQALQPPSPHFSSYLPSSQHAVAPFPNQSPPPASSPLPSGSPVPPSGSPSFPSGSPLPSGSPMPYATPTLGPQLSYQSYAPAPFVPSPTLQPPASSTPSPPVQPLHLQESTRDYPLPSPMSSTRARGASNHISPPLLSVESSAASVLLDAERVRPLPASVVPAVDEAGERADDDDRDTSPRRRAAPGQVDSPDPDGADEAEDEQEEEEEEDPEPLPRFDASDMLGRLCSGAERIRADDLGFWKTCMEGMEWALYDSGSPEVQKLLTQYCKALVVTAAKTRNLHALIMVICRHLENYVQTLHLMGGAGAASNLVPGAAGAAAAAALSLSSSHSSSSSASGSGVSGMSKDHVWVTHLLFFVRLFVQYILHNLSYESTLKFFAHLAVPDAASKPNTPRAPQGNGANHPYSSLGDQWNSTLSVPGSAMRHNNPARSRSPSPHSPRGGGGGVLGGGTLGGGSNHSHLAAHTPSTPKHHMINLNPSSRRGSLNSSSVDILTRFVCAIVNALEVLGDAGLNARVANSKGSSGASGSSGKGSSSSSSQPKTPLSSPSHGAMNSSASAAASSSKAAQPVTDLHLELLNTLFVLLSTQMYLPLSTEFEQVFLDRLLFCARPPMLHSMQGFVTGLIATFTEILPSDYATTVFQRAQQGGGASSGGTPLGSPHQGPMGSPSNASAPSGGGARGFFSKLTSKLHTLFTFPLWALRYLFTIPPNHPLIDRSTLLLELLVYQSGENVFRSSIKALKDADPPLPVAPSQASGRNDAHTNMVQPGTDRLSPLLPSQQAPLSPPPVQQGSQLSPVRTPEDFSQLSMLEQLELGAISFSRLYYALCSTLLSEHINLFLYTLIHENSLFRRYILERHAHDLDYMLMPQLEILYREVDISKHHVYMIINIWILLTQNQGFDQAIKAIRVKEVPFFKEAVLKDLALTHVMQIVLLRTLQLNLRTKLKEPHIFNNALAAFCNLTITALIGPPLPLPTPGSTPSGTPASTPGSALTPGGGGVGAVVLPMTLHPQVSFRLVRVLCILSRKFLTLQVRHENQVATHNALVESVASRPGGSDSVTAEEERGEIELEETAEELGTCMEFIQLLLEVVNHCIVHALPPPHPLAPPSASASLAAARGSGTDGKPYLSSLASNPHLLYNLLDCKEYFLQLLPYAHLFEPHLISNLTNSIAFYEQAPGVVVKQGSAHYIAGREAGGGRGSHSSKASEKEVEKCVAALRKAISHTPMSSASVSPLHSPTGATASAMAASLVPSSHALPPASHPEFDPSALIERGPFTYHEQENSQDFFIPYIYQLSQSMRVLPKMYAHEGGVGAGAASQPSSSSQQTQTHHHHHHLSPGSQAMLAGNGAALGDVDADVEYLRELAAEEHAALAAPLGLTPEERGDDTDEDDPFRPMPDRASIDDFSNLRIAIK